MKGWKKWAILLVVLLCAWGWGLAWWRGERVRAQEAASQRIALDAAGLVRAERERAGRMGSELQHLQEELAAAREAGVEPIIDVRWRTRDVPVEVPCDVPEPVEVPGPERVVERVVEAPAAQFTVGAEMEGFVTATDEGDIYVAGKFFVHLVGSGWRRDLELPLDDEHAKVTQSVELGRAIQAYRNRPSRVALWPRKLRHWRVGPVLGVGGCYVSNRVFVTQNETYLRQGNVALCGFAGWGAQF